MIQFDSEGIVGVEVTALDNEDLGKLSIDSPISDLVGMSRSIARDIFSEAHLIEFSLSRTETVLHVSETLSIGQLSEGHAEKLVPARKALDLAVAVVMLNTFLKLASGQKIHEPGKDGFFGIHKEFSGIPYKFCITNTSPVSHENLFMFHFLGSSLCRQVDFGLLPQSPHKLDLDVCRHPKLLPLAH